MTKPQVQTEVAVNGVNEQDTSAAAQRKPTKWLTKIRRVVQWGVVAGIVIYLIYAKLLGVGKPLGLPLLYIASPLGALVLLSVYFYEKKIAKITLGIIVSIFVLFTLLISLFVIAIVIDPTAGSKVAHNLTKEKILSLKLGMDINEVINTLGKPISENYTRAKVYYISYARTTFTGSGFEFNIFFDDNDKLKIIHIEHDDNIVYTCDEKECPGYINPDVIDKLISFSSE